MPVPGDDSAGFAEVERDYVLEHWLADFAWVVHATPSPRTRMRRPLAEARIGLVTTAGAHPVGSPPIGASGRAILVESGADLELTHAGYDTERAAGDLDVVHPVASLEALAAEGVIGATAPVACSTMGGALIGSRVVERGVPVVVQWARDQEIDLALLVPA